MTNPVPEVPEAADLDVPVRRIDDDLPLPSYARAGDAGADLYAAHDVDLAPGERALIGTGIAVAVPPGFVALVHPRSGLAARHGLTVLKRARHDRCGVPR